MLTLVCLSCPHGGNAGQKSHNEPRVLCSYLCEALSPFAPQAVLLAPFQLHPPVLEPSLHLGGEGKAEKMSAKKREEQMLPNSQAGRTRGRVTRWQRYMGSSR